jgi:anti-sigma regulatory factor (Ser/Thr protein kinase)
MTDAIGPSSRAERFEGRTESVRDARRFVAHALADAGDVADDAALLVSELATNAVIHAGSAYTVTVRRHDGFVRVEVADASPSSARRCRYSPTSGTGRGLGMVEDLSSGWGVEEDGVGKIVWFELPIPGPGRDGGAASGALVGEVAPEPLADHATTDADLDALLAELGGWDDEGDDEQRMSSPSGSLAGSVVR